MFKEHIDTEGQIFEDREYTVGNEIFIEDSKGFEKLIFDMWIGKNINNLFIYIPSDRRIFEDSVLFKNLQINRPKVHPMLDIIFEPSNTFNKLHNILVNDCIRDRLEKKTSVYSDYFEIAKVEFSKIFSNVEISDIDHEMIDGEFTLVGKINDSYFNSKYLSSGQKMLFYTMLYLTKTSDYTHTLLIDEPENHLHERVLEKLMNYLNEQTTLRQVFLISHNRSLLKNNVKGNSYIITEKEQKLYREMTIEELKDEGIYVDNLKILFVEDSDSNTLKLYRKIVDANKNNIIVLSLEGCMNVIEASKGIYRMNEHVDNPNFVFLIDKDLRSKEEKENLESNGKLIVLDKHELENYFLDVDVINELLNNQNKGDSTDVKPILDKYIKQDKNRLAAKIISEHINKRFYKFQIKEKDMRKVLNKNGSSLNLERLDDSSLINYIEECLRNKNEDISGSSEVFNKLIRDYMKELSDEINKYFSETWKSNPTNWCNGKEVLNQLSNELRVTTNKDDFIERVSDIMLNTNDGNDLKSLKDKILKSFNIE